MDFIGSTLSALSKYENSLKLSVADINKLPFASNTFGAVLAFGLYHNLENGLDVALRDTHRVLKKEGVLCASFRLDNLQNRLNDLISDFRSFLSPRAELQFHKANYSTGELIELFADSNFKIKSLEYVVNMPLLFKIPLFRDGEFDEGVARAEGYKLKKMPQKVQNLLVKHFPANFCNVAVVTAAAI